jgi:hypothetical protein
VGNADDFSRRSPLISGCSIRPEQAGRWLCRGLPDPAGPGFEFVRRQDSGFADVPSISRRDQSTTYRDSVLFDDLRAFLLWPA